MKNHLTALAFLLLQTWVHADANTYYSRASGPWTTSSTWSLSSGGSAISSGYPGAGDDVIIEGGYTVTIAASGTENLNAANVFIGGSSSSGTLSYPIWNPSSTLTLTGNLTIGGTGASAAGTLNYASWGLTITCARLLKGTGSASRVNPLQQDFTFTGSFTLPAAFNQFRNFIVNGGIVTLSGNIETNGSVSPDIEAGSTLDMGSYTMDIGGYQNFIINGTLILGGNSGGFSNSNFPTTFKNLTIGSNSTVIYSYPGNQTVFPATYGNLTLRGSGIKSAGTSGYVSGLSLTNGGSNYYCDATLSFTGGGGSGAAGSGYDSYDANDALGSLDLTTGGSGYTSAPTVVITGDCGGSGATAVASITIQSTVTGTLTIGGTASFAGTISYGAGSSLAYTGTAAQTTGAEFPATLPGSSGLIINNSNGVTLNGSKSIAGTLTLTSGALTTSSSNQLTITNTSASAISGSSSASFINGPLTITLPSGLASGSSYTMPIGKSAAYLPITLVNPTTSTGTITAAAEAFSAWSGGSPDGSILQTLDNSAYWLLTSTGNFTGSSISLTRPTALNGLDLIGESSSINGVYTSLGGSISGTSIVNSSNIGATSSLFLTMASDALILPVTLSALNARQQADGILLKWTVFTETGIDRYVIERSTDGQHYETKDSLTAKDDGSLPVAYNWLDRQPGAGSNIYRIKVVGHNDDVTYSDAVRVTLTSRPGILVYPNPARGNAVGLRLENVEKGTYQVIIHNQLGQPVYSKTIDHAGGAAEITLQPDHLLTPGVYRLQLKGTRLSSTVSLLIE
jgi:hypothetical protein